MCDYIPLTLENIFNVLDNIHILEKMFLWCMIIFLTYWRIFSMSRIIFPSPGVHNNTYASQFQLQFYFKWKLITMTGILNAATLHDQMLNLIPTQWPLLATSYVTPPSMLGTLIQIPHHQPPLPLQLCLPAWTALHWRFTRRNICLGYNIQSSPPDTPPLKGKIFVLAIPSIW
jgi:hypothetical protein